jgi:hypothetical protein
MQDGAMTAGFHQGMMSNVNSDTSSPETKKDPMAILDKIASSLDELRQALSTEEGAEGSGSEGSTDSQPDLAPLSDEELVAGIKPTPKPKGAPMKGLFVALLLVLSTSLMFAVGNTKSFPQTEGKNTVIAGVTYKNSNVDVLTYTMEPNLAHLTLEVYTADTASVTSIIIARKGYNGVAKETGISADTIAAFTSAAGKQTHLFQIQINPFCEALKFTVTFAGSGNKAANATAAVEYRLFKDYTYQP